MRLETDAGTGVFAVTSGAFSPFGQPYAGSAPGFFTGVGMNDHIAGWTFPARDQLPDQGRWLSPDPAGLAAVDPSNPQSWNRYAYVGNNPLNRVDPTGLDPCDGEQNAARQGSLHAHDCGGITDGGGGVPSPVDPPLDNRDPGPDPCPYNTCTTVNGGTPPQICLDCLLPDSGYSYAGGTGGAGSSSPSRSPGASNPPKQQDPCTQPILDAVNNQFGTTFNQDDLRGQPFPNGGGTNLNILGANLPPNQFNALQTGRYPIHWYTYLIGYGSTVHITGTTYWDPLPAFFGNYNIGGQTAVFFTAHTDSSFAYNPIGFLIHLIRDILHIGGPRNACPV